MEAKANPNTRTLQHFKQAVRQVIKFGIIMTIVWVSVILIGAVVLELRRPERVGDWAFATTSILLNSILWTTSIVLLLYQAYEKADQHVAEAQALSKEV
jgi:hypothetical protein